MDDVSGFVQHPRQISEDNEQAVQNVSTPAHSARHAAARNGAIGKQRLDQLLVERGLSATSEQARRQIMAGEVLVNEVVIDKPGRTVASDADVRVRSKPQFVSRGGLKLAGALTDFGLPVAGRIAIDVGASTGGFSDCLLQRGVAQLFAVDVAYGELAWKVRSDPRVVTIERTNIRYLRALPAGVQPDLAVIDASFISLEVVLPPTLQLLSPAADLVALIKPQFEAGRTQVDKGGVVRDEQVHRNVLTGIVDYAQSLPVTILGLTVSPLLGPAGNVEFFIWLRRSMADIDAAPIYAADRLEAMIAATLERAQRLRQLQD